MAVVSSHQHNRRGTEDGHRPPPINSIQGGALSSHHTFLPPPSSSSPTPNYTMRDVESFIWTLTVRPIVPRIKTVATSLKTRRTEIRFRTIGCVSEQLVWEITFSSIASPPGSCSEKVVIKLCEYKDRGGGEKAVHVSTAAADQSYRFHTFLFS